MLERDWRRFWTEDTRLLEPATKRLVGKPSAFEKKVQSWFAALNALRLRLELPPVGWVRWQEPAIAALAKALKKAAPQTDLLINLTDEVPAECASFPRVAEIVTSDDIARQRSRKRYAEYRELGHTLETHKI